MADKTPPQPRPQLPPTPPPPPHPPSAPVPATDHRNQENNEKQTEAGAGGITSQEFRQNHPQQRPPMPHELTAEWTVRAQLRFARAGETVSKEFSTNDPVHPVRVVYKWSTLDADAADASAEQVPTRGDDKHSNIFKRNSSRSSGYSQDPGKGKSRKGCSQQDSFRSTASSATLADFGGADSAFSGSNTSHRPKGDPANTNGKDYTSVPFYGTRCRSTCNIIVSAVADFLPPPGCQMDAGGEAGQNVNLPTTCNFIPEEEPDPFVFNTTACYTVQPEKSYVEGDLHSTHDYAGMGKVLNLRDAVCQTSDTETKYFQEYEHKRFKHALSPLERRHSQRAYDYRRATAEALLQPPAHGSGANEGNSFMPSYMSSPSPAFKSASMPRIPSVEGDDIDVGPTQPLGSLPAFMASSKTVQSAGDPQKKPRTVHIDVYCTGSEDEDHADGENSTESDDNRRHDQESNSTFQTVLDNEQMRLRHQRMTGPAVPRRIAQQQPVKRQPAESSKIPPQQPVDQSSDLELGHGITKSSTADEVNESKQLLFRKHIGDQRAIKLHNLRQKYLRQPSDDALSLGYPSSTRSTVRDNTCSSVSSVLASQDVPDSPWREADDLEEYSLAKSDSFEYENALDRLRIRQMERLWSRSNSKEEEQQQKQPQMSLPHVQSPPSVGHHLQTITEVNTPQRISPFTPRLQRDETLPSESDIYSENEQFYPYGPQQGMRNSPVTTSPHFQQMSHFARNRPGFLQFFGPQNEHQQHYQPHSAPVQCSTEPELLYPNYNTGLQRWKSETRENLSASGTPALTPTDLSRHSSPQPPSSPGFQRSGSEAPPTTTSSCTFPTATPTPARRFDMFQTHRPSPAASEASTQALAGYSSEYLDKARKFGKVVASRKPGHHVGPTKNPNCSCESCQRWLAERFQIRGRAFSLGESPILRRPQ